MIKFRWVRCSSLFFFIHFVFVSCLAATRGSLLVFQNNFRMVVTMAPLSILETWLCFALSVFLYLSIIRRRRLCLHVFEVDTQSRCTGSGNANFTPYLSSLFGVSAAQNRNILHMLLGLITPSLFLHTR